MKTISCNTCADTSCVSNLPTPCLNNPHHDIINAMDLVIAQKKQEREHQVLMQAYAQKVWEGDTPDNNLDFTDVRGW